MPRILARAFSPRPARSGSGARRRARGCACVLLRERAAYNAPPVSSPWNRTDGWTLAGRRLRRLSFRRQSDHCDATLWYARDGIRLEFAGARRALRFAPREGESFEVTL